MPAHVIVLGIEGDLTKDIKAYFELFRQLPPTGMLIGDISSPKGPKSFMTLLEAIKKSRASSFVLVVHGFEDGSGLYLKLAHNKKGVTKGYDTTGRALERINQIAARIGGAINEDDRSILGLPDDLIKKLLELRAEMQKKLIESIDFRGCNLGRSTLSLKEFCKFFGADKFAAPDLHSFFGRHPIGTGSHHMTDHVNGHGNGVTHTYSTKYDNPEAEVLQCIKVNADNKPAGGHMIATTKDAVSRWIKEYIKVDANFRDKSMPTHGLWERVQTNSNDALAFIDEDKNRPRPIWPLEEDYKKHIKVELGPVQMQIYNFEVR